MYENEEYGLIIVILIMFLITSGFIYEIKKEALNIKSRQNTGTFNKKDENIDILPDKIEVYNSTNPFFIKQKLESEVKGFNITNTKSNNTNNK
jgi:hypothetical protein